MIMLQATKIMEDEERDLIVNYLEEKTKEKVVIIPSTCMFIQKDGVKHKSLMESEITTDLHKPVEVKYKRVKYFIDGYNFEKKMMESLLDKKIKIDTTLENTETGLMIRSLVIVNDKDGSKLISLTENARNNNQRIVIRPATIAGEMHIDIILREEKDYKGYLITNLIRSTEVMSNLEEEK